MEEEILEILKIVRENQDMLKSQTIEMKRHTEFLKEVVERLRKIMSKEYIDKENEEDTIRNIMANIIADLIWTISDLETIFSQNKK